MSRTQLVTWAAELDDWSVAPDRQSDFPGQATYWLLVDAGGLLLGHRVPGTSLHYRFDHGTTWSGNVAIDTCIGAYPSMVHRNHRTVLFVYHEEGEGSSIRAQRLRVKRDGVESVRWE